MVGSSSMDVPMPQTLPDRENRSFSVGGVPNESCKGTLRTSSCITCSEPSKVKGILIINPLYY